MCLGTRRATALAGNEQVGMRTQVSKQGRRGVCMATPADRMHTATVLGARSSSQQCGRGAYAYGPNGGSSRKREISRHAVQQQSTPMKCEAAVAIQASKGLALVSASRQHAPSALVYFVFFPLSLSFFGYFLVFSLIFPPPTPFVFFPCVFLLFLFFVCVFSYVCACVFGLSFPIW